MSAFSIEPLFGCSPKLFLFFFRSLRPFAWDTLNGQRGAVKSRIISHKLPRKVQTTRRQTIPPGNHLFQSKPKWSEGNICRSSGNVKDKDDEEAFAAVSPPQKKSSSRADCGEISR